jgi:hypothetical protein
LFTGFVTAGFTPTEYYEALPDGSFRQHCSKFGAKMGFFSNLKFAHQITSAFVKEKIEHDDALNKIKEFRNTITRLEKMEIEMSRQACTDNSLNQALSSLRKTIAICKDTIAAYEVAAGVSQASINSINTWTKTRDIHDMQMIEQTLEASALARKRSQKLHAEAASLLKRFQNEAMAYSRVALGLV